MSLHFIKKAFYLEKNTSFSNSHQGRAKDGKGRDSASDASTALQRYFSRQEDKTKALPRDVLSLKVRNSCLIYLFVSV